MTTVSGNTVKRIAALLALILLGTALLFMPGTARAEEAGDTAEDLTVKCTLDGTCGSGVKRLGLADKEEACRIRPGKYASLSWKDGVPVETVYIAFYYAPVPYTVEEYDAAGTLLNTVEGNTSRWNDTVTVTEATRSVRVRPAGSEEVVLNSLYAYGAGSVPDFHPFDPTPEKADYMLFAMHPDDDVLFLGGLIPTYTAAEGRECVMVYMATRMRQRRDEAMNGAWTMGLRTQPVFGGFPDIPENKRQEFGKTFTKAGILPYIVEQLRRYKPEVVVTQDVDGEYGHWQHKLLVEAVREAVPLAADASYEPDSAKAYGTWEVKKLYLHLYGQNKISIDVKKPIEALGGMTAVQAATEAFKCHVSQLPSRHSVKNSGIYSLSDFGLSYTAVGEDTRGVNDMFEHIDPAVLKSNAPAAPVAEKVMTPAPEITPEPEPTAEPTPEPTPEMTAEPAITPAPAAQEAETTPAPEAEPQDYPVAYAAAAIALLAVCLAALVAFLALYAGPRRKRR